MNLLRRVRVTPAAFWIACALLVSLGYLYGLGGDHIPRNGDELVYAHIARMTSNTGHWLPLASALEAMRNTKPPLLFWQALMAGNWGAQWHWLNLRLPSVLYTWAAALMVGMLTTKIVRTNQNIKINSSAGMQYAGTGIIFPPQGMQNAKTAGALAALVYLSFFSTYRYGRPYLTSAPETFWLFGVFFAIAWAPAKRLASRWGFVLLAGLALGAACMYKSFAMVVPAGLGLALCYQVVGSGKAPWQIVRPGVLCDAAKVLAICTLALGVFGLWFALDPLPAQVWQEFVVGENAGKFKSQPGYLKVAFSGSGGVLVILTGYFVNAGFLLPLVVGAAWAAWRKLRTPSPAAPAISPAEQVMWLWLLALALIFMLPNQRSARYLMAAMPAVAVLTGVYWPRIARRWFVATLALCATGAVALGVIGYGAVRAVQDASVYSPLFWLLLVATVSGCVVGMVHTKLTRPFTALAGFAVLLALAGVIAPFNGSLGHFSPATTALLQGQTVRVPNNFNGQFERYTFIIPGAHIVPYDAPQPADFAAADVQALLASSRYALVQRRLGQAPCVQCRIVDVRWDLRSRQEAKEGVWAALKTPDTYWFAKEYLVEQPSPAP